MDIFVCVGSACHIRGAYNIINQLQRLIDEKQLGEKVTVKAALCLGKCSEAVAVRVDDGETISLTARNVKEFFQKSVIERLKE